MRKILLTIQINFEDYQDTVKNYIDFIINQFTPSRMRGLHYKTGKHYKYTQNNFQNLIKVELNHKDFNIRLVDDERFFYAIGDETNEIITMVVCLEGSLVDNQFINSFETFFVDKGIFAYEHDLIDDINQNIKIASMLHKEEGGIEDFSFYINENGREMVDIEKNPGHSHKAYGVWYGAWYRMWFGKEYYKYIDKNELHTYSGYETSILENDVTRITLYENIWVYNTPASRKKQWEFRSKLHIDDIAHRLIEEEKENIKADSEIEINIGQFRHGGVRLIRTYLKDGKPAKKSVADSVEEVEYSKEGKILFRDISNIFGMGT